MYKFIRAALICFLITVPCAANNEVSTGAVLVTAASGVTAAITLPLYLKAKNALKVMPDGPDKTALEKKAKRYERILLGLLGVAVTGGLVAYGTRTTEEELPSPPALADDQSGNAEVPAIPVEPQAESFRLESERQLCLRAEFNNYLAVSDFDNIRLLLNRDVFTYPQIWEICQQVVHTQNSEALNLLVGLGECLNVSRYVREFLFDCVQKRKLSEVRFFLQNDASRTLINSLDSKGCSLLHCVVDFFDHDMAEMVLQYKPEIIHDSFERDPLLLAVLNCTPELVHMLLRYYPKEKKTPSYLTNLLRYSGFYILDDPTVVGALIASGASPFERIKWPLKQSFPLSFDLSFYVESSLIDLVFADPVSYPGLVELILKKYKHFDLLTIKHLTILQTSLNTPDSAAVQERLQPRVEKVLLYKENWSSLRAAWAGAVYRRGVTQTTRI